EIGQGDDRLAGSGDDRTWGEIPPHRVQGDTHRTPPALGLRRIAAGMKVRGKMMSGCRRAGMATSPHPDDRGPLCSDGLGSMTPIVGGAAQACQAARDLSPGGP